MHPLFGLSSLLPVVLTTCLVLLSLRRINDWSRRRDLQLLILAAPVLSLSLALGGLHHFAGRMCFLGAPPWDYTLGLVLPIGMGLIALGALGLGLVQIVLMHKVIACKGTPAVPELQRDAERLAVQLGTSRPRVLLCTYDRPLALTFGLRRPTFLLSSWILGHLDRGEMEAVLVHELGHVAHRDYPVVWLATILRDAFFYLPTSRAAYRRLQQEKELACDDLAVGATKRPLALASALAKVWQQTVDRAALGGAQPLTEKGAASEGRIERLLAASPLAVAGRPLSRLVLLSVGALSLIGLLAFEAVRVTILLTAMGCGPTSILGKLF